MKLYLNFRDMQRVCVQKVASVSTAARPDAPLQAPLGGIPQMA
jgi:hypothetical protein